MTCIVSTVSSQYAVLASDSGITWDNIKATPTNKIVQQGTWLIGAAGADRVCDVVQFGIKYPVVPKTVNLDDYNEAMKFMVTKVVPVITVQDIPDKTPSDEPFELDVSSISGGTYTFHHII